MKKTTHNDFNPEYHVLVDRNTIPWVTNRDDLIFHMKNQGWELVSSEENESRWKEPDRKSISFQPLSAETRLVINIPHRDGWPTSELPEDLELPLFRRSGEKDIWILDNPPNPPKGE